METDGSFKLGATILGLRLSVEECTVIGCVTLDTDVVDAPNPLALVDVEIFGVRVNVGAKGSTNWGGCGGNAVCEDRSA